MTKTPSTTRTKPVPWLIVVLGLLVLGAAAAVGWSWYQKRYPSWFEEVRLSDGRVITIHQKREYHENYGTAQSWVTIDLPELGGKQVWHSYLMPMRVDVKDGVVYVFGRPRGPAQLTRYLYPKNHIVGFRWSGGGFARISFLDIPENLRREENIYSCLPRQVGSTLTLKAKDQEWCAPSGKDGQFKKSIDLIEYQRHADSMAKISNWQNRSE